MRMLKGKDGKPMEVINEQQNEYGNDALPAGRLQKKNTLNKV